MARLDGDLTKIVDEHHQQITRSKALETWGKDESIPDRRTLQMYYLGIFLSAELSFVLMALREYGYSELKISERTVLISYGRIEEPPIENQMPGRGADEPLPERARGGQDILESQHVSEA